MNQTFNPSEDFTAWSTMAKVEPEAFELLRDLAVNELIDHAPPELQGRLHRLQWRIDQERKRAKTPMAACLQLSSMMWDSVLGPYGLNNLLGQLTSGSSTSPNRLDTTACILPFKSR